MLNTNDERNCPPLILRRFSSWYGRMWAEKVTRHSQRDLVGTEEKCEYEAFVTDPCTCGMWIAQIGSDVERRKTADAGFVANYDRQGCP